MWNTESLSDDNGIHVYPVPAKDFIYITVPAVSSSVAVYDIKGTKRFSQDAVSDIIRIDVSTYSNGIYIIKAIDNKRAIIKKFVKE